MDMMKSLVVLMCDDQVTYLLFSGFFIVELVRLIYEK
jgi:hypothetical protein